MTTGTMIGIGIGVPLAAASVPVIIHLINLTRYRQVDWAAMEFLLAAYKKTRKRLQMESLIMLLLRVCAIVLLALAFFPFAAEQVKAWFSEGLGLGRVAFSANAPLHLVVVLDNSASMAYTQEGQTSFERAKKYGLGVVDGLTQGRDRVSIVRLSDIYVPRGIGGSAISEEEQAKSRRRRVGQSANLDIETARRQLAETTVAAVDTNMLVALREAYRLMDVTPATDAAALVVVSDFAGSGWQELMKSGAQTGEFRDVMVKINERMAKTGGAPVFYDAGFDEAQNLAITSLSCDDRVIGDGMETRINVEVANFSRGGEIKNISLVYRVDGREAKPAGGKVQLAAGQRNGDIQIVLKPEDLKLINEREKKTGASRHIEVEIVEPDGLKSDNRRNLVINVVPDVPILVVNGVADKNPRLDETIYLETALAISDNRTESGARREEVRITPNRVVSIQPSQLTAQEGFLDYRLVILANVASLPESTVTKLEEFVAAGFGLVIFDGDRVDHQRYNRDLYKDGKGLLPCRLKSPEGSTDVTAKLYKLVPADESHPVLSIFMRDVQSRALITDPEVMRNWRGVDLPQGAELDPLRPARVVLGINRGATPQPFMVDRGYGRGRVVYISSTASERWNELWSSGNGLPLFLYHETVNYLTNSEARYANLGIGESFRRVLRVRDIAPVYQIKDPAGAVSDIPATSEDGLPVIEFAGTAAPGVYTLIASERGENGQLTQKWQERFSVNGEARESDLVKVSGEERDEEGKSRDVGALLKDTLGEVPFNFQKAGGEREGKGLLADDSGSGLWLWLAALAAFFFLAETVWSLVISKPEQ